MENLVEMGKRAKIAARQLALLSSIQKDKALEVIAEALVQNSDAILLANKKDIENADANGIKSVMIDRLRLDEKRILAIADGVREVISLPDPVGELVSGGLRPNGLELRQVRVPLGVVGMIYESRPNVTVDAAVLCLKSGNACILRGGKEAIETNVAISQVLRTAVQQVGLLPDTIQLVQNTSRETATEMMRLNGYIDVLIPRGGAGLIHSVVQNATVPVIETGIGNCHLYLDSPCNEQMAVDIAVNAKCQRPSVCNAMETLLVHKDIASSVLPKIFDAMSCYHVEFRGCPKTVAILGDSVVKATEQDYATEFNDYIMAVKVVDHLDEAIEHIVQYSSGHSETIVTENYAHSREFCAKIDAAVVYVNASSRFTDGNQLGLGAEIGISTQKLHARGPMGLGSLTTTKHIVLGSGQIRE